MVVGKEESLGVDKLTVVWYNSGKGRRTMESERLSAAPLRRKCPKCRGLQFVEEHENTTKLVLCPTCGGSGQETLWKERGDDQRGGNVRS